MGYELVVVGTSYGGLRALRTLLAGLPADFGMAVAIVQHRSKDSDDTLTGLLQECSALPVLEVEDKEPIRRSHVYIGPPDYHLLVEDSSFALSTDAPVAYSRPSIDVLFESAAVAFRERAIGVVLTGANADGSRGLGEIKRQGGYAVVQDPAEAEGAAMPAAAVATVAVDAVLSIERIPGHLATLDRARRVPKR